LIVQGEDIIWRQTEEIEESQISALHHPGQRLMIFPIGERHQSMVAELSRLASGKTPPLKGVMLV